MGQPNAVIHPEALDPALACCRGNYQRAIIRGRKAWSGADLQGGAKSWDGTYRKSRKNLLARLRAAGLDAWIDKGHHNKQILYVAPEGAPEGWWET